MITKDCLNRVLPVVADSWDRLRGCDVYRLLNSIGYESEMSLAASADIVRKERPDLDEKITEAVNELCSEYLFGEV